MLRYVSCLYSSCEDRGGLVVRSRLQALRITGSKPNYKEYQPYVTNQEEREAARNAVEETVKERGLNLLINNAGVLEIQEFPHLTSENLELHFRVNTVAPVMVFQVS
ncbi:hypothetical protein AVEN_203686-1 [Araneus ventricosus]|uniref:Uncharacterized protein n=1 Tax=Araneus ventricosus TaxID=182803 RepID=A0A4Y2F0K9_ARAVE|nr:hypothetical protein AVEN_203686-1 [Araneus ventricosus]